MRPENELTESESQSQIFESDILCSMLLFYPCLITTNKRAGVWDVCLSVPPVQSLPILIRL